MRRMVICAVAALLAIALTRPAAAQTPTQVAKLFASAADVTALIDRAKRERKPDQPNFVQPIVLLQPYSVNLEYRVGGLNAPASIHEKDAELFLVLEGAGTVVTGGKLKDERRTNPANLTGTAIEGGSSRRLAKGDWVLVPENTAHWFTQVDGTLVMMSLHVPHP